MINTRNTRRGHIVTYGNRTYVLVTADRLIDGGELIGVHINTDITTPGQPPIPDVIAVHDTNGEPIGEAVTWHLTRLPVRNTHHTGRTAHPDALVRIGHALADILSLKGTGRERE